MSSIAYKSLTGAVTGVTDLTTTGNTILGNASTDTLNVGNGGIIKDASGKIGIGVTPTYSIDASFASSPVFRLSSVDGAQAYIQSNSNVDVRMGAFTNYPLLLQVNGIEKVRVDISGNVGIGVAPTSRLTVSVVGTNGVNTDVVSVENANATPTNDTLTSVLFKGKSNAGVVALGRVSVGLSSGGAGSEASYMTFGTASAGAIVERVRIDSGGQVLIQTAGKGLSITEGSNCKMGVSTLVAGTVTVSTTAVTATSRIFITYQSLGTISLPAAIGVTARTAGTSFTITSATITDTSVIAWHIVEPS